jgi:hypothetical protein
MSFQEFNGYLHSARILSSTLDLPRHHGDHSPYEELGLSSKDTRYFEKKKKKKEKRKKKKEKRKPRIFLSLQPHVAALRKQLASRRPDGGSLQSGRSDGGQDPKFGRSSTSLLPASPPSASCDSLVPGIDGRRKNRGAERTYVYEHIRSCRADGCQDGMHHDCRPSPFVVGRPRSPSSRSL